MEYTLSETDSLGYLVFILKMLFKTSLYLSFLSYMESLSCSFAPNTFHACCTFVNVHTLKYTFITIYY